MTSWYHQMTWSCRWSKIRPRQIEKWKLWLHLQWSLKNLVWVSSDRRIISRRTVEQFAVDIFFWINSKVFVMIHARQPFLKRTTGGLGICLDDIWHKRRIKSEETHDNFATTFGWQFDNCGNTKQFGYRCVYLLVQSASTNQLIWTSQKDCRVLFLSKSLRHSAYLWHPTDEKQRHLDFDLHWCVKLFAFPLLWIASKQSYHRSNVDNLQVTICNATTAEALHRGNFRSVASPWVPHDCLLLQSSS